MADGIGSGGSDWCTIESDPGVFTEMLEDIGCKHVELDELYSLDDELLLQLQASGKVYGLIFLFKWEGSKPNETTNTRGEPLNEDAIPSNLFFAHQVQTNACATQAILSVVLNAGLSSDELGPTLTEFHSFTQSFPPSLKGEAISSSDDIRKAHNAFSRKDAFLNEGKFHIPTDDDDVYHFVAYIPSNGTVYELDGLQKGPIPTGTYEDNDNNSAWLSVAREAIQKRMGEGHIKFNLMAVIQDKRVDIQKKLIEIENDNTKVGEHSELIAQLAQEEAKREKWKIENQRRRHNYVPLCMELLKALARTGDMSTLISEAKERHVEKMMKKRTK